MSIPSSIAAVVAYSLCSGSLVLVNKLILHLLPYPSLVITIQLWAALGFIFTAKYTRWLPVDPIRWKFVVPYLAYTVAFSLGVYCNMKSLSVSNVETVIVFRAMSPLLVSLLDYIFLGRELPSTRSWIALSLIILGAYGYAREDKAFQSQGWHAYSWPFSYLIFITFEMVYGKKIIRSVNLKTKSGPVLYTNLLGWPPLLLTAQMGGEFTRFWDDFWLREDARLPSGSIPLLLLGCVMGTGIGYSSWYCRDKVSATTFALIGVMNKCLTILLNLLVWDQHAAPAGIVSLFICLVGGSIYKQAEMRLSKARLPNVVVVAPGDNALDSDVNCNSSDDEIEKRALDRVSQRRAAVL